MKKQIAGQQVEGHSHSRCDSHCTIHCKPRNDAHQDHGHGHDSHIFTDTLAANNSNNGSGTSRVKVETKIQGFLTGCLSKNIDILGSSLSSKSTFSDLKNAIVSLANDISGKTRAKDMASSLTELGEYLTSQPNPVAFKKRKQIALLYELLKYSRKTFRGDFETELGSKFKRDKRYSGDQLANNQFEEVDGTYKDSTAWTSYLKDYLLYADCHLTTKETLILETEKEKCQVDDKFNKRVVVKNASSVHGASQANQPTPPSLVVADEDPQSCCRNGTCFKDKPVLQPTNLSIQEDIGKRELLKRLYGIDKWLHYQTPGYTDIMEKYIGKFIDHKKSRLKAVHEFACGRSEYKTALFEQSFGTDLSLYFVPKPVEQFDVDEFLRYGENVMQKYRNAG